MLTSCFVPLVWSLGRLISPRSSSLWSPLNHYHGQIRTPSKHRVAASTLSSTSNPYLFENRHQHSVDVAAPFTTSKTMASAVHCIACFEALDAQLNKRKPLPLDEIQSSWDQYTASQPSGTKNAPPKVPALNRLAVASDSTPSSSSSSSVDIGGASSTPGTSTSSLPLASVVAANAPLSAPLFVTWNTFDNEDDPEDDEVSLRGCIGTFEAQPLSEGLPEYALISALHDTRFPPVSRGELPRLQAAVTLLTDFEEVADPYDWVVGVHGVRLSFTDRGRRYGSTYLPDVASEQGWTKEEALFSLTRKAGWMGSHSRWRELDLKVTRYQGKKFSLGYAEFKRWREWVEA